LQHEGLDCCCGSGGVRPFLLRAPLLEAPLTRCFIGVLQEWDTARPHLEQGVTFYNTQQHRSQSFLNGMHQEVVGLRGLAQVLWSLGYPDQALQRSQEALTMARELAHPASVATALYFAADVHGRRREWQCTYELAEATLGLAREHGFAFWVAQATLLRSRALVEQGQGEAGLTQLCQGLAALRAIIGLETGAFLIWLAAAYGRVGQREEELRVAEEALAISRRSAELYRLKGELLLGRCIPDSVCTTVPRWAWHLPGVMIQPGTRGLRRRVSAA